MSRKDSVFRTSIAGNTDGSSPVFIYPIPADTSILAEAKLIATDDTNSPALGSAIFVSTMGAKRLGTAAATVIGAGNHALVAEVDAGIAGGTPVANWGLVSNNLVLQFSPPTGASTMFYTCEISLLIN